MTPMDSSLIVHGLTDKKGGVDKRLENAKHRKAGQRARTKQSVSKTKGVKKTLLKEKNSPGRNRKKRIERGNVPSL